MTATLMINNENLNFINNKDIDFVNNKRWKLYRDHDGHDDGEDEEVLSYTMLESQWFGAFDNGGEKMICFEQLLRVLDIADISKIQQTITELLIPLIFSNGKKFQLLKSHGLIPSSNEYTVLITLSNAERLCKIFSLNTINNQSLNKVTMSDLNEYKYRIRIVHECFGIQKGIWLPQLYTHKDAPSIECFNCGILLSPIEFVGHTHNALEDNKQSNTECHWGFNSNNWRWYIRLAEDPSRMIEEEKSLNAYLEEIKRRFNTTTNFLNGSTDFDRCTPTTENGSFNTSPSMPTPQSLSPSDSFNKISTTDNNTNTLPTLQVLQQFINVSNNINNGNMFSNAATMETILILENQLNVLINSILNLTTEQIFPTLNLPWKTEFLRTLLAVLSTNNQTFVEKETDHNNNSSTNNAENMTIDYNNNNNNNNSHHSVGLNEDSSESWISLLRSVKNKTLQFKRLCRMKRRENSYSNNEPNKKCSKISSNVNHDNDNTNTIETIDKEIYPTGYSKETSLEYLSNGENEEETKCESRESDNSSNIE